MPNDALAKIRRKANEIRKKHPGKKYSTALKEAGKLYREGRISGVRKKKSGPAPKKKSAGRRIGSVGDSHSSKLSAAKSSIKEQLGWALATQRTARTKAEKKRLQPKITELTRQLKALS